MDVILFIEKRFVIESNRENFYGEIIKENSGYAVRFVIESNRENFYGEIIKENSGYAVRKDEKKKI